ncbi:hypothetical protein AWM79_23570 [Pseudomonas agarici]|uniref:Uncharacterized protein n=1 Tax=Pseudomonas agarici TaxID=46677 RepID=A0A0X1T859_PSEAA|nr:hypothetical protein [Pseudomonas agarici]AMB88093.1 hypothetical protein AWM79_23570 [Pseudomonas agarici]SEK30545.1 hypothetical protein SAMN05216604_10256 [Pseudomonas agarici]
MHSTQLIEPAPALLQSVSQESSRPVASDLQTITQTLHARFGTAMVALLFYGSCLRGGNLRDGLVDLYVLVDDYASAHMGLASRLASRCLAPTVFLLKSPAPGGGFLRAKCALITLKDFEKGTSTWFQSYLWSRFSQPSRLVYYHDDIVRSRIHHALSQAVIRMVSEVVPVVHSTISSTELWEQALSLTYATELRPEKLSRSKEIVGANAEYFIQMTRGAVASIPDLSLVEDGREVLVYRGDASARHASRWKWKVRRLQGRTLNILRLIKALFTFEGAVDYALWKLERHLGEPVKISPYLHRYPLIFCWPLLWRLLRSRRLR